MAATPLEHLERARQSIGRLPRVQRELIVAGVGLAVGLLVMPFIVWAAGNRFLGPYTHGDDLRGGPWALFGDYVVGLAHGSAVFWVVALGPLTLFMLIRGFLALLRRVPLLRRY
jgi:hypothetical protein